MATKTTAAPKSTKAPTEKKLSALGAAAQVLAKAKDPMNCQEMITAMAEKKLWVSPGGATPASTLYAAIAREIAEKGKESRFEKVGKGEFRARAPKAKKAAK